MNTNMSLILIFSTCLIYYAMVIETQPLRHIAHDSLYDSTIYKNSAGDSLMTDEICKSLQPIFNNRQPDGNDEITIEQLDVVISQDENENIKKFMRFARDNINEGTMKISFGELLILLNEYNKPKKLQKTTRLATTSSEDRRLSRNKGNNLSMDSDEEVDRLLVDTLNDDGPYCHVLFGDLNKVGSDVIPKH